MEIERWSSAYQRVTSMQPKDTLLEYSRELAVAGEEVIAVKFRPVVTGAPRPDAFGRHEQNAWLDGHDYKKLHQELADRGWERETVKRGRDVYTSDGTAWVLVEHESGPELLARLTDIAIALAAFLAGCEYMRRRMLAERGHGGGARSAEKIRLEGRKLNPDGTYTEELLLELPVSKPLDPKEALEALKKFAPQTATGANAAHGATLPGNPWGVLKAAIVAVPAVKWALGVAGIVAVVAVIASFKLDWRVAVFGGMIVMVFMVVLVVFARLATAGKRSTQGAAKFLMWAFLLLMVGSTYLFASSVFFDKPLPLSKWVTGNSAKDDDRALAKLTLETNRSTPLNGSFRRQVEFVVQEVRSNYKRPVTLDFSPRVREFPDTPFEMNWNTRGTVPQLLALVESEANGRDPKNTIHVRVGPGGVWVGAEGEQPPSNYEAVK